MFKNNNLSHKLTFLMKSEIFLMAHTHTLLLKNSINTRYTKTQKLTLNASKLA